MFCAVLMANRERAWQATTPEATMPRLAARATHTLEQPHPSSHDCGQEHSLDHWLEVYWLVEEDYLFAKDADHEPHAAGTDTSKHPAKSAAHHHRSALRR
jgi:hypothetical protein